MKYLNIFFFLVFLILRSIKKVSLRPLKNLDFDFHPLDGRSLYRVNPELNGYNAFVEERFKAHLKNYFYDYYDQKLLTKLFPEAGKPDEPVVVNGKFMFKEKLPNAKAVAEMEELFAKFG